MAAPRCIVFGLGAVGRKALQYLFDAGYDVEAVYTRRRHVGEDIGVLAGHPSRGVAVQPVEAFRAPSSRADVALFFTSSTLSDAFGAAADCLAAGIDVVTIAEEVMYPWVFDPDGARRLDDLARKGGSTIAGVGINDAVMVQLPALATSFTGRIHSIEIDCTGDFGRLGAGTLDAVGVGQPLPEDPPECEVTGVGRASVCAQVADALYARLGLEASGMRTRVEFIAATSPLSVPELDRTVPPGTVRGIRETLEARSAAGPPIRLWFEGKVFEPGEEEFLEVRIRGEVEFSVRVSPLRSVEGTAATAVSRIPDVIAAAPGLMGTHRLRAPFQQLARPAR